MKKSTSNRAADSQGRADSAAARLLAQVPQVVTAGVDILADAVAAQGTAPERVDWRPPVTESRAALDVIAAHPEVSEQNRRVIERMRAVRPMLVDIAVAGDVIPALRDGVLCHAGPPIAWEACSGPMRGAIMGALIYEGMADSPSAAEALAASGSVTLSPCHHHRAVGPMAGVISKSMPVAVVRDAAGDGVAYTTLNEGLGKVLRYGAFGDEVIDRLRWMERVLGPVLKAALSQRGPFDLQALIAQALQMGDEGHNRNRAGTSLFLRAIGPQLIEGPSGAQGAAANAASVSDRAQVFRFIDGNDHFVLNLVMAACKLVSAAGEGIAGSSVVTTMARNGTEFGIRLAGTGERWFTAPAAVARGLFLANYSEADANPDIGDSAITETMGLGGFAMATAPAVVGFVGGTAAWAMQRTREMYEIALAENAAYQVPILEFRGTPLGIDAALVLRTGIQPQINTGIAGRVAGTGMVGAGLVEAPMACFSAAVAALARTLEPQLAAEL